MRKQFFVAGVFVLAMTSGSLAHADAAYLKERCNERVSQDYRQCSQNNYGNCDRDMERGVQSCQNNYERQQAAENMGASYGYDGRFRPVYQIIIE